ncbi:MAG: hypothetical protein QOE69_487 [Thermoleophilaceae bacterium]|nr:hypothetical protein [Thermoleophilaceae bacterium]
MAGSEILDWSEAAEGDVSEASRRAMSSVAERVVETVESGQPLSYLHGAVDELLDRAELVMGTERWGTGIEIGAGSAYVSAALSKRSGVERIYVLEPSREFVETVMPAVFAAAGADESKLVRVVGSFNRIDLSDESLDFVAAFAALHHSDDLHATLGELARVLRPGGFLVAVERYQPDNLSNAELNVLLDVPLDDELRTSYGVEHGVLRRRDVGEHEHRLAEWKAALLGAGFEIYPFMGVDFSGRRAYAALGAVWRTVLARLGPRLLRARRWQILGSQIPFDTRWLLRADDNATNLFLVARKSPSASVDSR